MILVILLASVTSFVSRVDGIVKDGVVSRVNKNSVYSNKVFGDHKSI